MSGAWASASRSSGVKSVPARLLDAERPDGVRVVPRAASNGDRSENCDSPYGKKRLREIDPRIYFLTKRLDRAEVVDPSQHAGSGQVFFGATVTYLRSDGARRTVTIVGVDEVDPLNGRTSRVLPVAKALLKAREANTVSLTTPAGRIELEIVAVSQPDPRGVEAAPPVDRRRGMPEPEAAPVRSAHFVRRTTRRPSRPAPSSSRVAGPGTVPVGQSLGPCVETTQTLSTKAPQ
jgi:transcription elongation factor GreB